MLIFKNAKDLEKAFNKLGFSRRQVVLIKAAKAGAEIIRQDAAWRAPRETGRLQEEMILTTAGTESNAAEVTVKIGPSRRAFYGLFQEIGTAHHATQPFLEPALKAKKSEAYAAVAKELWAAIKREIANG